MPRFVDPTAGGRSIRTIPRFVDPTAGGRRIPICLEDYCAIRILQLIFGIGTLWFTVSVFSVDFNIGATLMILTASITLVTNVYILVVLFTPTAANKYRTILYMDVFHAVSWFASIGALGTEATVQTVGDDETGWMFAGLTGLCAIEFLLYLIAIKSYTTPHFAAT